MRRLLFIGLAVTLGVGCGASVSSNVKESSAKFPPPKIRLGPVIPVADKPVEKVSATMDNVGKIHLLVAMKSPREVEYVVVDPDRRIHRERLTGYDIPGRTFFNGKSLNLEIATDGKGRLRAVVEDNAMILEGGVWRQAGKTPCRQYVRAGSAFYCAFISPGKDVGASLQWEWFGFGGGPAGIIFPWPSYPDKLIVLRGDGDTWGQMTVIDPDLKGDVETFHGFTMAGDSGGTVHLVYQRSWALISVSVSETRYVRLPALPDGEGDRVSRGVAANDNTGRSDYFSTKVMPYPDKVAHFKVAADPDSGDALLVYRTGSQKIRDDGFGLPRDLPLPPNYFNPRVASAGSGDFHAAAVGMTTGWFTVPPRPVYYLYNRDGGWSSPVELGEGALGTDDTFLLVADASRRAFVTWATDNAQVGRWVELEGGGTSKPFREKPESRNNRGAVSRGGITIGIDPSRIVNPSKEPSHAFVKVHDGRKPDDSRNTLKTLFGQTVWNFQFEQPETQIVRAVLEAEISRYLEKKGIRETRTYTTEITEFRVQANHTWQGLKVAGHVRLVFRGRELEHILSGSRTEKADTPSIYPGEDILQGVIEDSLRQAIQQLAAVEGDL